jgi:hypothetical protein
LIHGRLRQTAAVAVRLQVVFVLPLRGELLIPWFQFAMTKYQSCILDQDRPALVFFTNFQFNDFD